MTTARLPSLASALLLGACTTATPPQNASRAPAPHAASLLPGEEPLASADMAREVEPALEDPAPALEDVPSGTTEPSEPTLIPADVARLLPKRLYAWKAAWDRLLPGFSPRKFVLAAVAELPSFVAAPSPDDTESNRPYDVTFLRRHRSLFRPSPDGTLWADIYVATFNLDDSDTPLVAELGDTSSLVFLDPKTGASRVAWVFGISCGFDDASFYDRHRLVAVGSCVEGDVQRPFLMHVDLQRLILERFDYPDATSSRFDTERYIRKRNPSIRF